MPASERRTRDRLVALGVPNRKREGRVGGGLEYDGAALPEPTRAAVAARLVVDSSVSAFVPVEAVVKAAPAPASQPLALANRQPSMADKAVADARAQLVQVVLELEPLHGFKRACSLLAARLVIGEAGEGLQAIARAAKERARGDLMSARSLERWARLHKERGWWGLLPAQHVTSTPTFRMAEDVVTTLGLYHGRDARFRKLSLAAKEVTRVYVARGEREYDSWEQLYHRARRALAKLGQSADASVALIKARHTGAQRDARLPFKRRDTSNLAPLDVWVIDGHTFKAKVRHPDHGAPFAPEVTVTIDAATRHITGWSTNLSENVRAVGDALRHGVGQFGVPAILYGDNGAGETAKTMDCPIDGFCARLGIDHRLGLPGKPQGHGLIERFWQHMVDCAREFGSFQGHDVDAGTFRKAAAELAKEQRAVRRVGQVVKLSPKAPTWAQFVEAVDRAVVAYNSQHRHRSLPRRPDGKHMTPAEAWAAKFDPALQHKPSQLELRTLFMPSVLRTAKRGQVQFFNQLYQAPELMRRDLDGREVSVRYDIHDPSFVMVYTTGGEYVCEAKWNANLSDYYQKPVIEMAREKRVAAAVKRRELQIDTALRELGPPVIDSRTLLPNQPATPAHFIDVVATPVPAPAHSNAPERPAMFATAGDRYEWLMTNRDMWQGADEAWLTTYARSDAYADLRTYFDGRGLGWPDSDAGQDPVLKSAL